MCKINHVLWTGSRPERIAKDFIKKKNVKRIIRSYINKVLITKGSCYFGLDLSSPIWGRSGFDRNGPWCVDSSGPFSTQTEQNQKGLDLWECKITSHVGEAVEKKAPATCPWTQQVSRPAALGGWAGLWLASQRRGLGAGLRGTYKNLPPLIWYAVGSQGANRKDLSFSLC